MCLTLVLKKLLSVKTSKDDMICENVKDGLFVATGSAEPQSLLHFLRRSRSGLPRVRDTGAVVT